MMIDLEVQAQIHEELPEYLRWGGHFKERAMNFIKQQLASGENPELVAELQRLEK